MARLFLDADETNVPIAGDGKEVFGHNGDESVEILDGYTGIVLDQNIEEVSFEGNQADYTFEQQGINLLVQNSSGDTIATIPVQSDEDGTQLTFAGGTVDAAFDGSEIVVGGDPGGGDESLIDVDIDTAAFPTETDFDADGDAYNFIDDAAVSNYAVIENFSADDIISFVSADVNDYAFSNEGEDVTLSYNYNDDGTMNVIELTGVVSSDALVYDQASFTEAAGFDAFG